MTDEEFYLTSNLIRLRVIYNALCDIHECEQITQEELTHLRARVDGAVEKHFASIPIGD